MSPASHRVTLMLDVDYSWHAALCDAPDVSRAFVDALPKEFLDPAGRPNVAYTVVDAVSTRLADLTAEEPVSIDFDPEDDMGYPWHVSVDMRRDNTTANYEWTEAVEAKIEGMDYQADPETSCSYFYLKTEDDAKAVAAAVRAVWVEGL